MIDNWRKATHSADNSACVETGWADGIAGYRDTKQADVADQPALLFSTAAAHTFLRALKS